MDAKAVKGLIPMYTPVPITVATNPIGRYKRTSRITKPGCTSSTFREYGTVEQDIIDTKIKKPINFFIIPCNRVGRE